MAERKDVNSPQDIEEGINSTSTVTWDPFIVFPEDIYMKIFDKLSSPIDKQNFMNAHMKFHNLFESYRTLFLFQEVLKEIAKKEEELNFKDYQQCRLVCHDWDNGTQNLFQLHSNHFKLDEDKEIWIASCLPYNDISEPCKVFRWRSGSQVENDLKRFSFTHPPSKNPFFSRKVTLYPGQIPRELGQNELPFEGSYKTSVEALLERYGKHIWHCNLEIYGIDKVGLLCTAMTWIARWLELMPELKTLKIYCGNYFLNVELEEFQDIHLVQPELKNLVVLKSYQLQAVFYNQLFGKLNGLEKIQIQIPCFWEPEPLRDFEISSREALKEAFLYLNGRKDFEYLEGSEPFPNMKKLTITFVWEYEGQENNLFLRDWSKWRMIFKVLEEKFPALEDLSLRLPKAVLEEDRRAAIDHSLECQLHLKKLKKLRVNVPNLCSFDFLQKCKALEDLRVILEHSEWDNEESINFKRIQSREKTNFNMDLTNMWESNIWTDFPNLCKFKIWAWRDSIKSSERYTYEKIGEERKYDHQTYPEREVEIFSDSD